jgi:hypothetical protein
MRVFYPVSQAAGMSRRLEVHDPIEHLVSKNNFLPQRFAEIVSKACRQEQREPFCAPQNL